MNLSEKLPWLTWKNVHLVAVACIAVGFIILAVGMAIIGSIVAGRGGPGELPRDAQRCLRHSRSADTSRATDDLLAIVAGRCRSGERCARTG